MSCEQEEAAKCSGDSASMGHWECSSGAIMQRGLGVLTTPGK